MGNKECFEQLVAAILAIPESNIVEPNMPVEIAAQEAENTHDWATRDKDPLTGAGLDWSIVESLPIRAGALRRSETMWFTERFTKEDAARKWAKESPAAYELRDRLIHFMLFAYRIDTDILGRIQTVAQGTGHADMVQDLSDLAGIGRKYPEQLNKISQFDPKDLDLAETLSADMARLLAGATATTGLSESKIVRDKAFTYLKEAVDEVRAYGQFLFWKQKDRQYGYASQYYRNHRNTKTEPPAA